MKFRSLLILSLALIFTLSACDSDNNDDDPINLPTDLGKMEASIDGVQWTAASATANKTSVGQLNTLIVAGAKANADVLTMSLANSSGVFKVGTYDLSGDVLVSMSFTYGTDIAASYLATTGTVEIASINEDTVKGTFVFTATNLGGESITVTSGSFDVGYGINIHL